MAVRISRAKTDAKQADAIEVRTAVFVEEQGVPESLEIDGKDDEAHHVVAYANSETELLPVGAGRLREVEDSVAKLERISVLKDHRGEGIGQEIVAELEAIADEEDLSKLVMHAQTSVEGLYRELGYETTSEVFDEAGIPHVEMAKTLS